MGKMVLHPSDHERECFYYLTGCGFMISRVGCSITLRGFGFRVSGLRGLESRFHGSRAQGLRI